MVARRPPRGNRVAGPDTHTADLFDHYGVPTEPAREPGELSDIVEGHACAGCGWLRSNQETGPCPLCALPAPGPGKPGGP